MKYTKEFESLFNNNGFPVFTLEDVMLAFKSKGISYNYLRLMLHKYLKSGKIKRISRGIYTFHDDAIVVGFAFRPFYYGLESALNILGFSTQGANNIVITTRNVRPGIRVFEGRNYKLMRIKKEYFFGYKLMQYNGFWVPVSDLEKTLIDTLYFKIGIRNELKPSILKALDRKKLKSYLEHYNKRINAKIYAELK
jgi:predicted transcriptional regulator of viral defense system